MRSVRILLKSCRQLTLRRFLLLMEAGVFLIGAKLATRILPFRVVANYLGPVQPGSSEATCVGESAKISEVARAVIAIGKWIPTLQQCLHQGIAAQSMLSRRRIASTLYFGVKKEERREMLAHAWVRAGTRIVVGGSEQAEYHVIAAFGTHVRKGDAHAAGTI